MMQHRYNKPAPNVDATEKQRGLMTPVQATLLNLLGKLTDNTGWITFTAFSANWEQLAGQGTVQWRRVGNRVEWQGAARCKVATASPTTVGTMPAQATPTATRRLNLAGQRAASLNTVHYAQFETGGALALYSGTYSIGDFISLDGVWYMV